ncbi:hypothetical protein BGZ61DRAFT_471036 [Ilyonectria robusta]|uniref:uncharacterized protein n=1 Tax=Ilyonectria robusta TaxID=1079257 RepID=UPI001E8DDA9D|nr:uncharacterized protein BGZ61DRAFT_471036 [Ilyonectria robusta]KAH8737616.1 hypothetical protein BGZ61DRAFT_471036 [Ilyonectria robusta]
MVRLIPAVLVALALPGINAGPCKVPTTTTTSTSATTTPSTAPSCTAYTAAPYGAVCGGEGPPPGNPPTIATLNLPTSEECAYACYQTACSKFGFTTGNCILYGERQEQRLVRLARTVCPPYYDLACFDCSGTSMSTAPGSTTTTTGSTPTTTPENSATSPTTTSNNTPTTTPENSATSSTTTPENSTTSPTTTSENSATAPTTTPNNTPTTTPENSATSPTTTSENSATAPTTTPNNTPTTTPGNSATSPTTTPENSTTSPTTTSENSATAPTTTPESTPTTTPENSTTSSTTTSESTPTTTPEDSTTSPTTTTESSATSPTTTPQETPTTTPQETPTTTPQETPTTTPENSATSPTTTTTAESTTTTTTTTESTTTTTEATTTESTTTTTEATTTESTTTTTESTTTESTTTTTESTTTTSSTTSTTTTAAPTCDAYKLVPSPPSGAKCGFEGVVNTGKSPIATASKQNKSDCAKLCVDTVGCESFSYNSKSHTCSLFDCSVAAVAHSKSECGEHFYDKTCFGCSTTTTTTTSTTTTSSTTSTTTTAAPTCDAYQMAPSPPSSAKCGFEGGVKSGKHAIATATKQKQSDCAKFCADNTNCQSFSYNSKTDICSLFDSSVTAVAYAKSSCGDYFYDNACYVCQSTTTPPAVCQPKTTGLSGAVCGREGTKKNSVNYIDMKSANTRAQCAQFCFNNAACDSWAYRSIGSVCTLYDRGVSSASSSNGGCGVEWYDRECYSCPTTTTTPPATCSSYSLISKPSSNQICNKKGEICRETFLSFGDATSDATCAKSCNQTQGCKLFSRAKKNGVYKCSMYSAYDFTASIYGVAFSQPDCYECCDSSNSGTSIRQT